MTTQEFSEGFDTLLNSYIKQFTHGNQGDSEAFVFDEYEKSVYLTRAQEILVLQLYNSGSYGGDYFEKDEQVRRYLEGLLKIKEYKAEDALKRSEVEISAPSYSTSTFFALPDNLAFITLEQVIYDDESLGCFNGREATVIPVYQDAYAKIKRNPFRGHTKYKVIRVDYGNSEVELISKYKIGKYIIKYISKPEPIILLDLPNGLSIDGISTKNECKLNEIMHKSILDTAVQLALSGKKVSATK
jgi:hypothetical protein